MRQENLIIEAGGGNVVSGILQIPSGAHACYVMAHGAGAGMTHPFMQSVADHLYENGVASLRFNFPFMEVASRRPDQPAIAHATVRAAVEAAGRLASGLPLFAGGKSFGGRMSSQAQAIKALPTVVGLVFIGFPLHPAGKPSDDRARHLFDVDVPMLFVQGTRDTLADNVLIASVVERLGKRATLASINSADHAFHVPVRSGRTDTQVLGVLVSTMAGWMRDIAGNIGAPHPP